MTRIGVAASNRVSAEAGIALAEAGGNAIDAAIAATLTSVTTEPGVCSLIGGSIATVAVPGYAAASIDGNVEMPGRGLERDEFERGMWEYTSGYAGGMKTVIGPGTVATPGTPALLAHLHAEWGRAPWRDVVEPSVVAARDGFALGRSNAHYLEYVHDGLFGWDERSRAAIHDADGELLEADDTIHVADLADTMEALGSEGVDLLYRGELGAMIVDAVRDGDGVLTRRDLSSYELDIRLARRARSHGWELDVPAAPNIGGAVLAAMLLLMGDEPKGSWVPATTRRVIQVQLAALQRRASDLDVADDLRAASERFIGEAVAAGLIQHGGAPSTVHTSVVDSDGLAVAITSSSGYGSGMMPAGTGLWLNNALGEFELNRRGIHVDAPGGRLPSNMAPSIARSGPRVMAIGSPGADRITTAILQAMLGLVGGRLPLDEAIRHPRVHVVLDDIDGHQVWHEDDLEMPEVDDLGVRLRTFPPSSMSFGGVGAVLRDGDRIVAETDNRRDGAALTSA